MSVDALFDAVARRLVSEGAGIERGPIMHSDGIKLGGKFFAFASRGDLVVKVPAARVQELVGSGEGRPFESGGRRMREWVRLAPADQAACAAYVAEARAFAAAG
jgi:hypothetical protein